jgi:alanine racemase
MREATASIDLNALRRNLQRLREHAPASKLLAVVKADGYGHGLERVVCALRAADGFGVAGLEDATRIRQLEMRHGWARKPVVLLSGIDESRDVALLDSLGLDCVLHDPSQLQLLERTPAGVGTRGNLWIKLDTGMHRLGFEPHRSTELYRRAMALSGGQAPVWMTHFASADEPTSTLTATQITRFAHAVGKLPGLRSMANSAAIVSCPQAHGHWVRPGGLLYGLSTFADRSGNDLGFEPVMTLHSRIIAIKQVPQGDTVGYGESERVQRNTRLGIISMGYGDGYPRQLSGTGARVLIDGQWAPLLGRVSMDLCCIDISDLPSAQVGSSVILWGTGLAAEQVAAWAQTISYELTCGITRRVAVKEIGSALPD